MLFNPDDLSINRRSKQKLKGTPRSLSSLKPPVYEEIPYVELSDAQLALLPSVKPTMVFDVETYPNYFLISFMCVETNQVIVFEDTPDSRFDRRKLAFVIKNCRLVSFNGRKYDVPMMTLAYFGADAKTLKEANDKLIAKDDDAEFQYGIRDFIEDYGIRPLECVFEAVRGPPALRTHARLAVPA
jgi:hypothetical protein